MARVELIDRDIPCTLDEAAASIWTTKTGSACMLVKQEFEDKTLFCFIELHTGVVIGSFDESDGYKRTVNNLGLKFLYLSPEYKMTIGRIF